MDFVFQGFQTNLPLWVYILLIAGASVLAWWSYKDLETLKPFYRYFLTTLRSGVFLLLFLLLLNPFFRQTTTYNEKPEFHVYLDNSASTSIQKGEYDGISSYQETLNRLNFADSSEIRFTFYSVNGNINRTVPGSLSFDDSHTNLFNVVDHIKNRSDEIRASILISDGIFNQGRNPVFEAGNLQTPVFAIALGDTSSPRDLIVQEVTTNTTGYLNTSHPVEVKIRNNGFAGTPFEVQLKRNDEVLDRRTVNPTQNISIQSIQFELQPGQVGLQQYQIEIPARQDEWTSDNNTQPFSINILDDKLHILSLAFEIHPDVKLVRSILLGDQNIQLANRTWIGGNRFIEQPFEVNADSLDLLIVHGFPASGVPTEISELLKELLAEVPALIMALPGYNSTQLASRTGIVLPINHHSPIQYVETTPVAAVDRTAHPVMELPAVETGALPPILAPVSGINSVPGSTVLFRSSYRGTETNAPLIAVQEVGNIRRAEISGYGWYRFYLSPNLVQRQYIEQLITNLTSWTATRPDNRRLKISPTKEVYTGNEPVSFNAFLTNESGNKESEATIDLTLSGETIEDRYYTLESLGEGQYSLEIGSFPRGIYQYEAVAEKGERLIDRQRGEFSISSSNIEYINTQRNDRLLEQIAERTGGALFLYNQTDGFKDTLRNRNLLQPVEKTESTFFYPYRYIFWFLFILLLLTGEWTLRKYLALP